MLSCAALLKVMAVRGLSAAFRTAAARCLANYVHCISNREAQHEPQHEPSAGAGPADEMQVDGSGAAATAGTSGKGAGDVPLAMSNRRRERSAPMVACLHQLMLEPKLLDTIEGCMRAADKKLAGTAARLLGEWCWPVPSLGWGLWPRGGRGPLLHYCGSSYCVTECPMLILDTVLG